MARIEVNMPKMGESIMEGTVVEWTKKVGDTVRQDETLLEIATDKVDSEVPAPVSGVLVEILVEEGETVEVGSPIAVLETDPEGEGQLVQSGESTSDTDDSEGDSFQAGNGKASQVGKEAPSDGSPVTPASATSDGEKDSGATSDKNAPTSRNGWDHAANAAGLASEATSDASQPEDSEHPELPRRTAPDGRFFSPLVRSIARQEGISRRELESLKGSGSQGRVTKKDVLEYVRSGRKSIPGPAEIKSSATLSTQEQDAGRAAVAVPKKTSQTAASSWTGQKVEIIKMDRMRKVIAEHMVRSKQTSAHVTTFGEADLTRLVQFREKNKERFFQTHGFKLTFTPFFIEATIQALREFPLLNSSVDGDQIVIKKEINYGVAVSLGEAGQAGLVVPVIKNADEMNIVGLARATHQLARKARSKELSPDDLFGGTFTLTNYGSVGNLMGTPIINQPQVAIFGTGIIQKRPVVIEVEGSDTIAIRHMVYLSMSYDHRIIDGAMGGAFVQRVSQLLEQFDTRRSI